MKPDWKTAPQDAMYFNDGAYWKVKFSTCAYSKWDEVAGKWTATENTERCDDHENNPEFVAAMNKRYGGIFKHCINYLDSKHGGEK